MANFGDLVWACPICLSLSLPLPFSFPLVPLLFSLSLYVSSSAFIPPFSILSYYSYRFFIFLVCFMFLSHVFCISCSSKKSNYLVIMLLTGSLIFLPFNLAD